MENTPKPRMNLEKEARLASIGYAIETSEATLTSTREQLEGLKQTMSALQMHLESLIEEHDQRIGDANIDPRRRDVARVEYEKQGESERLTREDIRSVNDNISALSIAIDRLQSRVAELKTIREEIQKAE